MRKTKAVSLLLSLALLASLAVPGTLALSAQSEGEQGNSGMVISKNATANVDGTYTITLEAYATGNKIITETKKDIPTDIVLVLDQSGSMKENMSSYDFRAYSNKDNSDFYNLRHNGDVRNPNLYYPLGDGAYATVSVAIEQELSYSKIEKGRNNDTGDWWDSYTSYWENRNNLYALVGSEYVKVTLTRNRDYFWNDYTYTYTIPNNTVIAESTGDRVSPTFSETDDNVLYLGSTDQTKNVYTYTYTDAEGVTQTIGTSTGASTRPDFTLYERYQSDSTSRLAALKTAVSGFADSVAEKAKGADGNYGGGDDVDHRIAVVKFTSSAANLTNGLVSMNNANGLTAVKNAVNSLNASGDTYPATGLDTANSIFQDNPVDAGKTRNRVIVLFTDGYPAESGTDAINYKLCDDAIKSASISKKTCGATVYTVGIFDGANPSSDINTNFEYGNRQSAAKQLVAANRYMHYTSTNFENAQSMQDGGTKTGNGYYLSASDAGTLSNIFQQISDQIEQGGSSTTLSAETVIKDIIAPEFTLPDGAAASDITLETYSYTGENQWAKNDDAMGAIATVTGDMVDVSGFDFAENYVGTVTENGKVTYRGDKLVITFIVNPKAGFLGGNNVYTNTSAGVYENSEAGTPVMEFERPQVNVPIKDVTVTAEDKNVYLLSGLTAEELRSGAAAKVGNVTLDLTKPDQNYGLEEWQTSYVDIAVSYADADGNEVADLSDLKEDTTYQLKVTVSPKPLAEGETLSTEGEEAKETSGEATGNINVFKPELSYQDSEVYYGDTVPADFSENLTDTKWKHNDVEADTTTMGEAPALALTYTPDATKIADGKINTKQDVGVDVEVKLGDTVVTTDTIFLHTACTGTNCSWNETTLDGSPAFLLHVNTCQLTISKTGGASDEPYVFIIKKDGVKYSEITIVGNNSETIYELPVGTYTIEEDTGWSWRFSANNGGSAELTAENHTGSITCNNNKTENYWLNGFSSVWKNIFGEAK